MWRAPRRPAGPRSGWPTRRHPLGARQRFEKWSTRARPTATRPNARIEGVRDTNAAEGKMDGLALQPRGGILFRFFFGSLTGLSTEASEEAAATHGSATGARAASSGPPTDPEASSGLPSPPIANCQVDPSFSMIVPFPCGFPSRHWPEHILPLGQVQVPSPCIVPCWNSPSKEPPSGQVQRPRPCARGPNHSPS